MNVDNISTDEISELVRIYGTDVSDFSRLGDFCDHLSKTKYENVILSRFMKISGSEIIGVVSENKKCIIKEGYIELSLSNSDWLLFGGLVDPFCRNPIHNSYQWIIGENASYIYRNSPISLLLSFSKNGDW